MAEQSSSQERTEEPTERKKKESRKKGQVARSRELNTMLSLLIGGLGLIALGNNLATDFISLFESAFTFSREAVFNTDTMALEFVGMVMSALGILAPLFAVLVFGAIVGPLLMGGLSFSPSAMAFKIEKLSPLAGLKRIFSAKGLLELLKALFKFGVLSATTFTLFNLLMDDILLLNRQAPVQAFSHAVNMLQWCLVVLSLAMIFIVVFDVPFELWNHNKQLKMTLQEVKDEMKESEGRPEVKGRIRNLQREIAQRRMMEEVPNADVIITNPTHFAVALKYDALGGKAPVVLAKGRNLIAARIREVAHENDVAIFSAPPLARALFSSVEIGDEIPQNLYLAVAKVLAYIFQLRTVQDAPYAPPPQDIDIPEEYRDLYQEVERNGDE